MNQLQRASWIATSYMMTITAFQSVPLSQLLTQKHGLDTSSRPLYGKLSDIFGRFCVRLSRKNCLY